MNTAAVTKQTAAPSVSSKLHRVVAADGVELALTRFSANSGAGVPVLLTHGTFSNGAICSRLGAYLAGHGFDSWVLELRGRGQSQRVIPEPTFEAFGLLDVPTALEAVRDHTSQPRLFLVGHSGGGLAFLMHLARRPAERASMMLIASLYRFWGAGRVPA
jgi:pimeloyl-ACP methyl ester carboxylesterase